MDGGRHDAAAAAQPHRLPQEMWLEPAVVEDFIAKHQSCHESMEDECAAVWDFEVPWKPFMLWLNNPSDRRKKPNYYSAPFKVGSYDWKILFTVDAANENEPSLSVFLDNVNVRDAPEGWQCLCIFKFELLRLPQAPGEHGHSDMYTFVTNKPTDRGYHRFQSLQKKVQPCCYQDPTTGEMVFGVRVSVKDCQTQKESAKVGLRNQGATCYLNSFLQTLFHLPAFRSATYRLPISLEKKEGTKSSESSQPHAFSPNSTSGSTHSHSISITESQRQDNRNNVAYQLARLFYKIQTQSDPPRTTELTESFGWTRSEAFEQHDVQELARILIDNLETKMKGTVDEKTIQHLFRGKIRKYVQCKNIDYCSSTIDTFLDLQLQVKGFDTLLDSFEESLKKEELTGDNKYHCQDEERGIDSQEDAEMGVEYLILPPVLVIHISRFDFDLRTFQVEKVNSKFKFPVNLDMSKYLRTVSGPASRYPHETPPVQCDLSDEEWEAALAGAANQEYKLHSVLVHSGYVHGGHYHAYIAPDDGRQWLKFDDAKVTEVTEASAVVDNYGGRNASRFWLEHSHKDTSAYMLVYVRKDRWDEIVKCECAPPEDLAAEFKAEDEADAQRERESQEAHLYAHFTIYTEADIKAHVDNRDHGQVELLPDPRHVEGHAQRKPIRVSREAINKILNPGHTLDQAVAEALKEEGVRVWPTTHWCNPKSHGSGYPVPGSNLLRQRLGESRSRHGIASLPLFKLPPDHGRGGDLVFVKEYVKNPKDDGTLVFRGCHYLRPDADDGDVPPAVREQQLREDLCAAFDAFRGRDPLAMEVFIEEFYTGEPNFTDTGFSRVREYTGRSTGGRAAGTVYVVSWPLPQNAVPQPPRSPAPTEHEIVEAERVLGKLFGLDRHNVYQFRKDLNTLIDDLPDTTQQKAATAACEVLTHPDAMVTPDRETSVVEYYKLQKEKVLVKFVALNDDGRKAGSAIEKLLCGCWSHASLVRELGPLVKHPPARIRLWTLTKSHKDKQLTDAIISQGYSRIGSGSLPEIGYELLDFSLADLTDDKQEISVPFMDSKLKVRLRPSFLVSKSATVQEVLDIYRKKLHEKLPVDDCPKDEENLQLLCIRNSRIEWPVKPTLSVNMVWQPGTQDANTEFRVEVEEAHTPEQFPVRVSLIEIRDTTHVSSHGTPFLMYLMPSDTCEEVLNAARSRLCLRAALENAKLFLLRDDCVAMNLDANAVVSHVCGKSPDGDERILSLGIEYKKRTTIFPEKAIKIHN